MLRLTPLRTMTRTGAMLSSDQRVEGAADVLGRDGNVDSRPFVAEQDEPKLAADGFLVALESLPGAVAVGADRCGPEQLLHRPRITAGKAQRCEESERDRVAVRDACVAGGRLQRVRGGMTEVE